MSASTDRLFLLGVDGLPPRTFRRFLDEGLLPNCAALVESAAYLDVVPTLPATTAPGWAVIASGAHPRTIGILNILQPVPDGSPDSIVNGFDRSLGAAEFLWEALASEGRRAIVVKYPGSWPPSSSDHVQVDGAGGYADITCRFEALCSAAYVTELPESADPDRPALPPRGYSEHWRIDGGATGGRIRVEARDPLAWRDVPRDFAPRFEVVLPLQPAGRRERTLLHGCAGERDGRPVLVVAREKGFDTAVAELRPGEWSGWIDGGSARGPYAFRTKLLELDLDARRLWLYRGEGHLLDGFTVPESLAGELVGAIGPVVEWTGTFDSMHGLVDLETQLELYDAHTAWLEDAVRYLTADEWDAFFLHWHVIEYAHHLAGAALDDAHPHGHRDRERYLSFLRRTYGLLDRLVGTAVETVDAEGGALVLASDHGHDLVHSLFYVNDFLRDRGWLAVVEDGEGLRIDWSRSSAYGIFPGLVVVNRASRWEGGIVADGDAGELLGEIETALRLLVDPRTGRAPVSAVIRRGEMPVHGYGGPSAPDLFFTMDRGYEPATRLRAGRAPVFELTEPGRQLTSGHGAFHPASPSARTLALVRHPAVRPGSVGRNPVAMVDLAPTMASLLGCRPPRDADGRALDFAALGVANEEVRA